MTLWLRWRWEPIANSYAKRERTQRAAICAVVDALTLIPADD